MAALAAQFILKAPPAAAYRVRIFSFHVNYLSCRSGKKTDRLDGMDQWLLLTDYASKYRISVSTLRRRIKSGVQPHRFEAGRYYLPDHRSKSLEQENLTGNSNIGPWHPGHAEVVEKNSELHSLKAKGETQDHDAVRAEEPLLTTTTKLLNELKQAYTLILQEKEEQILYLKEEIADLKTLVRVLESDNARLRDPRNNLRELPGNC
jgi:hypothetical protein